MVTDPWKDKRVKQWMHHVRTKVAPMMESSNAVVSIAPNGETDVKFAVELGLAIMYNKPIIVVAPESGELPPKLVLVADRIVSGDVTDPEFQTRLVKILKEEMDREH